MPAVEFRGEGMRRSFVGVCVGLAFVALGAAGCSDDDTTTPTTPTPTTVTESFTGALNKNGAVTFSFSVGATGQVTATLTELASSAVPVGLSLGNWNGTTCQIVLANDNAVQGTFVTGNMSATGSLCVRLYDASGNVEAAVPFKVDVVHP
jgi:hypothetical protein